LKLKIAYGICIAISLLIAIAMFSGALQWSLPYHRESNPLDVLSHPLSLIWMWSWVIFPILILLTLLPSRIPILLAGAVPVYALLYLVWATFLFGRYGFSPGPLVWSITIAICAGLEYTFCMRWRKLAESNKMNAELFLAAVAPREV
jgi:hypothetical protein